jgi:hypothetical protein
MLSTGLQIKLSDLLVIIEVSVPKQRTCGLRFTLPPSFIQSFARLLMGASHNRAWACGVQAPCPCPVRQIRPTPATQSSERGLPARRHRPRCLDARRLGGRGGGNPDAAGRRDPEPCLRCRAHPRRRHHGAGPGQGQDPDRRALDLCARRSSVCRAGSAGGVLLFAGSWRRASGAASGVLCEQADAYAGFSKLYEADRKAGPILEAVRWAHGRRKFSSSRAAHQGADRGPRRSNRFSFLTLRPIDNGPSKVTTQGLLDFIERGIRCNLPHEPGEPNRRFCAGAGCT